MKFESRLYRDGLAEELKQQRKSKKESASDKLEDEKENPVYKASKIIHELRRLLPLKLREELDELDMEKEDSEKILETFDVIDVSHLLTEHERLLMELEIIDLFLYENATDKSHDDKDFSYIAKLNEAKSILGYEVSPYEPVDEKVLEFFDEITDGEFFNNHNLNHVVGAASGKHGKKTASFEEDSLYEPNPVNDFYVCAGKSPWVRLSRPLIILSPHDIHSRQFIEHLSFVKSFNNPHDKSIRKFHEFDQIKFNSSIKVNRKVKSSAEGFGKDGYDDSETSSLLFLADYPMVGKDITFTINQKPKWSEIATIIVNLREGKIYKRKSTEASEASVKESIKSYRERLIKVSPTLKEFEEE